MYIQLSTREKLFYAVKKRQALWLSKKEKERRGIKFTIRLASNFPRLWERIIEQTPDGSCQWGNTLFLGGEGKEKADLYVILNTSTHDYSGIPLPAINFPPPERVWGLHMEPPNYVKLFGLDRDEEHQKVSRFYTSCDYLYHQDPDKYIPSPPYVLMHLDRSFNFLKKATLPQKPETLGMISSSLNTIDGHKTRLEFIDKLARSNLDFSLWGRGQEFKKYQNYRGAASRKWDVLSSCKYSIVVENSIVPYYWSEKISDSLLSFCLPLYYGSPNVSNYLPQDCYIPIDIHDPNSIEKIKEIIKAKEYEKRFSAILEAREKILNEQNLFAFLNREINMFHT